MFDTSRIDSGSFIDSLGFRAKSRSGALLWSIFILGAVLRLYRLGNLSFWYDEAATIILSRDISALPQSLSTSAPLPFVIAHFCNSFGQSEFWARLWPALFGIAIIPVVWALAKALFGNRAGLIAAALTAVNPLCIYYSQELRAYSMLPFFVLTSAYCWLLASRNGRWWPAGALASLFLALSFYSHYYAVVWIASLPLAIILLSRTKFDFPGAIKLEAKVLATALVLVGPWLSVFLDKATTTVSVADFWIPKPTLKTFVISLENFSAGFTASPTVGAVAAVLTACLAMLGFLHGVARTRMREVLFLAVNLLLPVLIAFTISRLVKNSVYLDRCLIPSAVFLTIIAAYGVSILRPRVCAAVLIVLFLLSGFSLHNHYRNVIPEASHCPGVRQRKEFRQASQFVMQHLSKGDLVGHSCRSSLAPFLVYLPEGQRQVVLASSRQHRTKVMQKYPYKGLWSTRLSETTLPIAVYDLPPGYDRLIFVASEWDIGSEDFYSDEKRRIRHMLDEAYPLRFSRQFYGAPLYFYDLKTPIGPVDGIGSE